MRSWNSKNRTRTWRYSRQMLVLYYREWCLVVYVAVACNEIAMIDWWDVTLQKSNACFIVLYRNGMTLWKRLELTMGWNTRMILFGSSRHTKRIFFGDAYVLQCVASMKPNNLCWNHREEVRYETVTLNQGVPKGRYYDQRGKTQIISQYKTMDVTT